MLKFSIPMKHPHCCPAAHLAAILLIPETSSPSYLLQVCEWPVFPSSYYLSTISPLTVPFIERLPFSQFVCHLSTLWPKPDYTVFSDTEPASMVDLIEQSLFALPSSRSSHSPHHWSLSVTGYMTWSDYILVFPFGKSRA